MTGIPVSPTPTIPILLIATCLTLAACSDEPDNPAAGPATEGPAPAGGTVTPGQGLSLTPRPGVVVDLATAQRYEAEGEIEAAAEAYIAIAAAAGTPDRIPATLAAARLLIEAGQHDDATVLLEPLVPDLGATPDGLTAAYLLGRAYTSLGRWQEAVDQFDAYIKAGGPATPYAHLERSESLIEMDRGIEAAESAQAGLNLGPPASMTRTFVLAMAEGYERAGAVEDAIANYNLLIAPGALSADATLGLQRIAALKQQQGDPTYTVERDSLMREYPASQAALAALRAAQAAAEAIDPVVQGLILYRHNEYTEAEPHFRAQIEADPAAPESATAHYYLAAIQESRGENVEALLNYSAVDTADPDSSVADDALWWRARIHEQDGDLPSAAELYSRIVDEYSDSSFAGDAAFRRGLLAYRTGAHEEAASIWRHEELAAAGDDAARQRLLLWQGKALNRANMVPAASEVLAPFAQEDPVDYFGIRAKALSDGFHEAPTATVESTADLTPAWDWAAAEQWLTERTGDPINRQWEGDQRWIRARELWRVGRNTYGDREVNSLIAAHRGNAPAIYTLSRELRDAGRLGVSAGAGELLLIVLEAKPSEGLPKAIMSLAYPAAFGPLVQRYAEAEGISPLLLLAITRQESTFQPRAVSPANAVGLTQLLPETARIAATDLGMSLDAPEQQLLHADLNLRLGARHMAGLLQKVGGNVFVALAAYNAGGTAAERWAEAAGNDADLYLETVEFAETRHYIEVVAENYAIYRYIYGGEPEPNLPQ
jgi:peptidoglycan lytic transglycosylase